MRREKKGTYKFKEQARHLELLGQLDYAQVFMQPTRVLEKVNEENMVFVVHAPLLGVKVAERVEPERKTVFAPLGQEVALAPEALGLLAHGELFEDVQIHTHFRLSETLQRSATVSGFQQARNWPTKSLICSAAKRMVDEGAASIACGRKQASLVK